MGTYRKGYSKLKKQHQVLTEQEERERQSLFDATNRVESVKGKLKEARKKI